ncbi:hypothetical protein OG787_22695 [Streptomyces sp. NBC_00075]|uniref:Integral membrane protein n=1 Tax=Streptomyces sp. NBC_00093 TaxID=2975649 RepID=A0AAU2A3C4_9ACTN
MTGTGSDSGRSLPSTFPRRVRHALGDLAALVYLGICAVLLVWALVVTINDSTDESMALVIPMLATAPASFVLFFLPDGPAMVVLAIGVGALVNATVIGWCARVLRRGPGKPDRGE